MRMGTGAGAGAGVSEKGRNGRQSNRKCTFTVNIGCVVLMVDNEKTSRKKAQPPNTGLRSKAAEKQQCSKCCD